MLYCEKPLHELLRIDGEACSYPGKGHYQLCAVTDFYPADLHPRSGRLCFTKAHPWYGLTHTEILAYLDAGLEESPFLLFDTNYTIEDTPLEELWSLEVELKKVDDARDMNIVRDILKYLYMKAYKELTGNNYEQSLIKDIQNG